jgi:hypothetical protein
MLTVEQLEAACSAGLHLDFSTHPIEVPDPPLRQQFYPLGFPAEIRTNSAEVLQMAEDLWGKFEKLYDTDAIRVDVHVAECDSAECPPEPSYRLMWPLMLTVADAQNYMVADLTEDRTRIVISNAGEMHSLYFRYFFLEAAVWCHIATRHATPVHAGCVALNGRGVLLLGDSGAGKSSLSYACARRGWTYVTDDASYLLNCGGERMVTGNSRQVRLRPTAAELFPEIDGMELTPRAAGQPSIELPTASLPHIACSQLARVDFLVFLKRCPGGLLKLAPYRADVARYFMRQQLYGSAQSLAVQYRAIEGLLSAKIFELRYGDLDSAIDRLRKLVWEGQ